jgi:hypothetical protein
VAWKKNEEERGRRRRRKKKKNKRRRENFFSSFCWIESYQVTSYIFTDFIIKKETQKRQTYTFPRSFLPARFSLAVNRSCSFSFYFIGPSFTVTLFFTMATLVDGAEARGGEEEEGVAGSEGSGKVVSGSGGPATVRVPLNEPCRFLEPSEYGERIVLASYPRSGNSLLRRLLESITGIVTGSDTKPGRGMAELLRKDGLVGEGETSQRVWTVKCHFPERLGWKYFKANRGILLVRHPINAIKSYFHMQLTASHHLSLAPSEFTRFPKIWDEHVAMEAEIWVKFHTFWLKQNIPTIIVRYEDLLMNKEDEMKRIYRFLYRTGKKGGDAGPPGGEEAGEEESVQYSERLLRAVKDETAGHVYKPRAANVQANFEHYTEEQRELVLGSCQDFLYHLGYADEKGNPGIYPKRICARNKGKRDRTMMVNKGVPARPATEDDPARRGFPWKMALRPIVNVVGKKKRGDGNQADNESGSVCSSV